MRAKIHQSMVRAPLLGGGHPRLTVINVVLAWRSSPPDFTGGRSRSPSASVSACSGRSAQRPSVILSGRSLRHLREPAIRMAHGRAWGTPEKPKPTVPPLPRWMP